MFYPKTEDLLWSTPKPSFLAAGEAGEGAAGAAASSAGSWGVTGAF